MARVRNADGSTGIVPKLEAGVSSVLCCTAGQLIGHCVCRRLPKSDQSPLNPAPPADRQGSGPLGMARTSSV